ncbi:MAG: RnfABCDGE type electron transport complex subunit B [candidate division WOR-3 bacterium]|nr:RnfABCDGE type electron transport complex subunit B [candidate division WOR-3 bacterium]
MSSIIIPVAVLGGLALVFGCFLVFSAEKFKVELDERVKKIKDVLPGIDCGACGAPGCTHFAEGVVNNKYPVNGCKVGGEEVANKIAEIMGVNVEVGEEKVAVLRCLGDRDTAKKIADYKGIETCVALNLLGGNKGCQYGCLELGDCVRACPSKAIIMGDKGLPYVLEDRCTGCGVCVETCPRGLFELIPRTQDIYIACRSYDDAKTVKQVCSRGCVGCSLCARITEDEIITMDGNLPEIHWNKLKDSKPLEQALEKCPSKTFVRRSELKGGKKNA